MFAAWCGLLALALVGLHLLGSGHLSMPWRPDAWPGWVATVGAETAIAAVLRVVALALAWYLVVATLAGAAAAAGRGPVARAVQAALPRFLRSLVLSARGLAISSGGLAVAVVPVLGGVGVAASESPEAAEGGTALGQVDGGGEPAEVSLVGTAALGRVGSGGGGESAEVSLVGTAALGQVDGGGGGDPAEVSRSRDAGAPESGADGTATLAVLELAWESFDVGAVPDQPSETVEYDLWEVSCGDHFWSIAAEVVTEQSSGAPDDAAIDSYWRTLVDANRGRLVAPGNPDLLVPGQTLVIPPVATG